MNPQVLVSDRDRSARQGRDQHQTEEHQGAAGREIEIVRSVGEDEFQMAPAIAEGSQMRRAVASVGTQRCRDLRHAQTRSHSVDDHFGRELHTYRAQFHPGERRACEGAHAAMEITNRRSMYGTSERRQYRVAEIAMQRRHGMTSYPATEAVSHHQIESLSNLV